MYVKALREASKIRVSLLSYVSVDGGTNGASGQNRTSTLDETIGATMMMRREDLEYLALRLERYAREDHVESQLPEISAELRSHRQGRCDGLRWAAREVRSLSVDPTPDFFWPHQG